MKSKASISPPQQINAFLIVAVISSNQVGVGVMGFQQQLYLHAKQDAWISVLVSFILAHLSAIIMIKTLELYQTKDLYEINQDVFGKFIGNFLTILYISYSSSIFFLILKMYIEVINTWVFYNLSPWFLAATLLLLLVYAFLGDFRVIVGVSFFSFVLTFFWLFSLIPPLKYANTDYLLPVFQSDILSILKGTYSMTFTIVGFEIINIIYPFIKDKKNVKRYTHLGLFATLLIYFPILLVSLVYFSGEQLSETLWATLTMLSVVRLPFVERIDIFMICFGMIIILPNLCLYAWAVYRGINSIVKIRLATFIWPFSGLMFILSFFAKTVTQLDEVNRIFMHVGFIAVFIYPILLYFLALLRRKFRKTQVIQ